MEHIRGEFRQLADAGERRGVHQEGRQDLREAGLARVHVEKEIRDGALEPRAEALVNGEARARDFHGRLEIEDFQRLAQFPMGLRGEIELRRRAPAAHLHVVRRALAHRDARVRDVRNRQHELAKLFVQLHDALVVSFQLLGEDLHLRENHGRIAAGLLEANDFVARFIPVGLPALGGGDDLAAVGIEVAEGREVERDAAVARHLFDRVEVLPHVSEVEHRCIRIAEVSDW